MSNAWHFIKPNDYDAHMSHPNVAQTQMLNRIIKEQFELLPQEQRSASCVAILGITNGNGLEHVIPCGIDRIIGIDINKNFLDECRIRFSDIESKLSLYELDLMTDVTEAVEILSECDLIIANLLIEHIHLENFLKIVSALPKHGQIISCVIQVNPDGVIASASGIEYVFDGVVKQVEEENENIIISSMKECGMLLRNKTMYNLPNEKQFIRLDFIKVLEHPNLRV